MSWIRIQPDVAGSCGRHGSHGVSGGTARAAARKKWTPSVPPGASGEADHGRRSWWASTR
jgi:hypothetical protein